MAEMANYQPETDRRASSVWWTLKIVFGLVPIVAGLDKYFNLLVVWEKYLAKPFASIIPMSPSGFMHLVGIIEIVAGIGVLFTPWTRVFAWVVAIWLWCISIDLIVGGFYDIAVRDIVMGISSLCLARLTAWMPARAADRAATGLRRTEVHA
jgi:uncharacterized membrane protein YphA (DoxX/SURF4 family)